MPVYEFYCNRCNMIFNFFSKRIDTTKRPDCPRCNKTGLERMMSGFAVTGRAKEQDWDDVSGLDQGTMEKALGLLEDQAGGLSGDDPRQAARIMRRLGEVTGLEPGPAMQEALDRMEQGQDPELIESEMGSLLEQEEPFLPGKGKKARRVPVARSPVRDGKLYDL